MCGRKWNTDKSRQSKLINFTKARVKEGVRYYFRDQLIPEASSFKCLGIIILRDLNWVDLVNYTLRKAQKANIYIKNQRDATWQYVY